jgi:hypothetical protein
MIASFAPTLEDLASNGNVIARRFDNPQIRSVGTGESLM